MASMSDEFINILDDKDHPFHKPYETAEECEGRVNAFWEGVNKLQMDLGIHDVVCAFSVNSSLPGEQKSCSSSYFAGDSRRIIHMLKHTGIEVIKQLQIADACQEEQK